ncbi:MAG: glycosyltransferase [Nitrososphaeraceae archaeon]|nr:glycosyltransferase [Nitrososphaeraceae archaeon]
MKTYRDQSLQKHDGIFGNIIFDLLLIAFAVSLLISPSWFDINDVIYQFNGLKDYIFRNFIPTSLYNYWLIIPLGIIGIWRWTVWLIKKIVATLYSPITPGSTKAASNATEQFTVSVIIPVYKEDKKIFKRSLESWWKNNPAEIIAIIDKSDLECVAEFKEFQQDKSNLKLIVTSKPGKRAALADGISESKGSILALTDSDTMWDSNFLENALRPFQVDPKIGGVTPKYHPIETRTIWQKMTDIFWDMRNYLDMPAQTAGGKALSCLSGKTALYRREILVPKMNFFLNENILGRKKESGEDKCFTRLVQQEGWKTYYQSSAVIYSSAAPGFDQFIRQRIRWARNSHNSDFQSLWSGWVWKCPYLAFSMIDRFISVFTLLLGPIFLTLALIENQWGLAISIVILWFVGRTIKIFPHLRRNPKDFLMLPIYLGVSFLMALTRLYALVTIRDQHFIRGIRKVSASRIKKIKDYFLTAEMIAGIFIFALTLR